MEDSNLELFYDVLDESINFLYEKTHLKYMELLLMSANNILAAEVIKELDDIEDTKKLTKIYERLTDVDFSVEDIRKALQAIILKGFKESRIPNGQTTPDTIGMFMAYLISRFDDSKGQLKILDPLIGTGNLTFSIANHLENEVLLYGIDNDELMINLSKISSELLQQPLELFFQDTLGLNLKDMDYVVFDCPHCEEVLGKYFPYQLIQTHVNSLKDNGYMIGVIPNDFFDYDKSQEFKKSILDILSILAIIELPGSMFVGQSKSILVMKRAIFDRKKCLMVKLPSFSEPKELNKSLVQIEEWFENNIKKEKE